MKKSIFQFMLSIAFTIALLVSCDIIPPAIEGLEGTVSDGTVQLKWKQPAGLDVEIWYGEEGADKLVRFAGTLDPNGTSIKKLVNGKEYQFEIFAISKTLAKSLPTRAVFTPKNITKPAPGPVTNLTGVPYDGRVVLTWTNPADCDRIVVSYEKKSVTVKCPSASAEIKGLQNDKEYEFTIVVYNDEDEASKPAKIAVTPEGESPTALIEAEVDRTNISPIYFTVVFSEAVFGFEDTDIPFTIVNGELASKIKKSINPNTYEIEVTPIAPWDDIADADTTGFDVEVYLEAGVVTNVKGISNLETDKGIVRFDDVNTLEVEEYRVRVQETGSVFISWSSIMLAEEEDNDFASVIIKYWADGVAAQEIKVVADDNVTIAGLDPSKEYFFELFTVDDLGNISEDSQEVVAKPDLSFETIIERIDELPAVEELTLADKDEVESIRAAYENLSTEDQAKVTNYDPEFLEAETEIQRLVDEQNAAVKAVEDMITALPPVDDLTLGDRADVEAAKDAFDALTEEQQDLVSNSDRLEDLIERLDYLEQALVLAQEYEDSYAYVLGLTDETVVAEDTEAIEEAQDAYNQLPEIVQKLVSVDNSFFTDLLDAIDAKAEARALADAKDAAIAAINGFGEEADYSAANWIDLSDKKADGVADVEAAATIAEVDSALAGALADLATVLTLDEEAQIEADAYKATYKDALELTVGTVRIADEQDVIDAANAYQGLSDLAKEKVLPASDTFFNGLLDRIEFLKDNEALVAAQEAAKVIVNAFGDQADYSAANWGVIGAKKEYGCAQIDATSSIAEVAVARDAALADLATVLTLEEEYDVEAAKFIADNSEAIALAEETVAITDRDKVEQALEDYKDLSSEAKTRVLPTDQDFLEGLLNKIVELEAEQSLADAKQVAKDLINAFGDEEDYSAENWSLIGDIKDEGIGLIDAATSTSEVIAVTNSTMESLAKVKTKDQEAAEEAQAFKDNHKTALDLTEQTVSEADTAIIEAAQDAYYDLSDEAKDKVAPIDEDFFNDLLDKIEEIKQGNALADAKAAAIAAINAYGDQRDYSAYNWNTMNNLKAAGVVLVQKAVDIPEVETERDNTLAALAAILTLEQEAEAAAAAFEAAHAAALALTPNTVQITDKAIVEDALADYLALSALAKTKTWVDEDFFTSLLDQIEILEEAVALAEAKIAAKAIINAFGDESEYIPENWTTIIAMKAAGVVSIDGAGSVAAVIKARDDALANLNSVITINQAEIDKALLYIAAHEYVLGLTITTVKVLDQVAIENAQADFDLLSAYAQTKVAELVVSKGITTETVDEQFFIDLLDRIAYIIANEALVAARDQAIAAINAFGNQADYSTTNWNEIRLIKTDAIAAINISEDIPEIEQIRDNALADMAAVITLEQQATADAAAYMAAHGTTVGLTVSTVAIEDEVAVLAAQTDYGKLSTLAKSKVPADEFLFEDLLDRIQELKDAAALQAAKDAAIAEVNAFGKEEDYSAANWIIIGEKKDSGIFVINAARNIPAVGVAKDNALADLATVKTLDQEATDEANAFKTTHAYAISRTLLNVVIGDKTAVQDALTAYNNLSDRAKVKVLPTDAAHFEDLLTKIAQLEADAALAAAKAAAVIAINDFGVPSDYSTANWATITTIKTNGVNAVNASTTVPAVETARDDALAALAQVKTLDQEADDEAALYKATHADAIALTVSTVKIEDRAKVEAADSAYDNLSALAKTKVMPTDKDFLKSLLDKITELEAAKALADAKAAAIAEVNAFGKEEDYSATNWQEIISKKAAGVSAINAATDIPGVNTAKANALADLATVLTLDQEAEIEANAYKVAHATALGLTEATVKISDKAIVLNAQTGYNNLSSRAKTKVLPTDAQFFTDLLAKIAALEAAEALAQAKADAIAELNAYKDQADYSSTNWSTILGYKATGVTNINAATSIPAVTSALEAAKTLIDGVLTLDQEADIEANAFKTTHADAIALTVETVAIEDEAKVEAAEQAYSNLSGLAKTKVLPTDAAHFDALLIKIAELKAAKALADAKAAAIAVVQGYKNQADYSAENWNVILGLKQTGIDNINAATNVNAVNNARDNALAAIDLIHTLDYELQQAAQAYVINHGRVLSLTLGTVTIHDETDVDDAIADYDALVVEFGDVIKSHLTQANSKANRPFLESLKDKIEDLRKVTGITVSPAFVSLAKDATRQLNENITPDYAANKAVVWTSSNNSIATVSITGLVTGVGPGIATITATTDDGGFTAEATIGVDMIYTANGLISAHDTGLSNSDSVTKMNKNITITGTAPAGYPAKFRLQAQGQDDRFYTALVSGTNASTTISDTLPDGAYTINLMHATYDTFRSSDKTIYIDTVGPVFTWTYGSLPTSVDYRAEDVSQYIVFTSNENYYREADYAANEVVYSGNFSNAVAYKTFDTNVVGTQNVTITAVDAAGNIGSATRTLKVNPPTVRPMVNGGFEDAEGVPNNNYVSDSVGTAPGWHLDVGVHYVRGAWRSDASDNGIGPFRINDRTWANKYYVCVQKNKAQPTGGTGNILWWSENMNTGTSGLIANWYARTWGTATQSDFDILSGIKYEFSGYVMNGTGNRRNPPTEIRVEPQAAMTFDYYTHSDATVKQENGTILSQSKSAGDGWEHLTLTFTPDEDGAVDLVFKKINHFGSDQAGDQNWTHADEFAIKVAGYPMVGTNGIDTFGLLP